MIVEPKVRYWSHDVPEGSWEAIVIGSGMGGMTSAALLSKLGKRVLVIEQHVIPGGFTQTFKRPGYQWDVGVHIVGEMTERSYVGRLLRDLTDGRLVWESVGEIYDEFNFPDGFTIQFPNSKPAFRDTLYEYFPNERQAIDRYLEMIRAAAHASAGYMQARVAPKVLAPGAKRKAAKAALPYMTKTTAEVLEGLTDDYRLRAVLAAQWGYYGSTPSKSSFAMHALMVAHFLWGAFYPVGSAESIAREMLRTVADAGGWTLVRTEVEQIVVRAGKAVGVRLAVAASFQLQPSSVPPGRPPLRSCSVLRTPGPRRPFPTDPPMSVSTSGSRETSLVTVPTVSVSGSMTPGTWRMISGRCATTRSHLEPMSFSVHSPHSRIPPTIPVPRCGTPGK